MKYSFAEQRKASLPIALSFDQLQLGHMPFHHAIIHPPGEPCSHRLFVFLDSCGKGLEFGDAALVHLGQPTIKALSQALTEHLGELLDQIIGQIDFGMELAKHEQGLLLLSTQFFRATKKKENRLSCKHRRARKLIRSVGILPSFWKETNQLLIHRPVRVGVATGYQFPMQLSDIVATSFPSSGEMRQVWIKTGHTLPRLLFGKRGTFQPARDGGMADPHLVGNGRLREALFA